MRNNRTHWRDALSEIGETVVGDLDFERVEAVELILKRHLKELSLGTISGADARFVASWYQQIGFVLKYKPYGIKCATPFGYSIFFLEPNQGFSFQRHLVHKTEVFHILQPLEGARVFFSTSEEWDSIYERTEFDRWLRGKPITSFERFARRPSPGDVYHINDLGIVHSALGCVLEEFATASIDLVDRLHDQNGSRTGIPTSPRDEVLRKIRSLPDVSPSKAWWPSRNNAESLAVGQVDGHSVVRISTSGPIVAERYTLQPNKSLVFLPDARCVRILMFVNGVCETVLRGADEASGGKTQPSMLFNRGDVLVVLPTATAVLTAPQTVSISSHLIDVGIALS
jgi:hypothetical protein